MFYYSVTNDKLRVTMTHGTLIVLTVNDGILGDGTIHSLLVVTIIS
jgi:hypothetical protein